MTSFCPRKYYPTSPPLMWMPAAVNARRGEAARRKLPDSFTLALKPAGNSHTQEQQSVRRAARSAPGQRAPGRAVPPRRSEGAGARVPQDRRGGGGELPTLSSTKSPSRGRRQRPPRVLVGKCPIAARTGTRRDRGAGGCPGGDSQWRTGAAVSDLGRRGSSRRTHAAFSLRRLPFVF